jgi:hypothetical protein
MYPIMGEPFSKGAVHYITIFGPSIIVVGATGISGICAANIVTSFEYKLYP